MNFQFVQLFNSSLFLLSANSARILYGYGGLYGIRWNEILYFGLSVLWCVLLLILLLFLYFDVFLLLGSRLWTCSSDSSVIYTRQKCDNWSRGLFRSIKEREEIVCTKGGDDLTHDVEISFNASDRTNLFRDFWKIRASFRG